MPSMSIIIIVGKVTIILSTCAHMHSVLLHTCHRHVLFFMTVARSGLPVICSLYLAQKS